MRSTMRIMGQVFRFGAVGVLNTAIGLAVILALQNGVGLNSALSNLSGYLVGLTVSYHLHRTWTFRHRGNAAERAPRYLISVAVSYLLNLATLTALLWLGVGATPSQIAAVGVYATASFALGKWFIFVESKPSELR